MPYPRFAIEECKTLLFIPASEDRFIAKAHTRGADAIILDLEDAVEEASKDTLRDMLPEKVSILVNNGVRVTARVDAKTLVKDAQAAHTAGLSAIVLPKVDSADSISRALSQLADNGLGQMQIIAQIEHINALPQLDAIASAGANVIALAYGTEDLAFSAGMASTPQTLYWPYQQLLFACRRNGVTPLGYPGSITEFKDIEQLETLAKSASEMGFGATFCIHPAQVDVFNRHFQPSVTEIEEATVIITAARANASQNRAVFAVEGKMVDAPVIRRAQAILAKAGVDL